MDCGDFFFFFSVNDSIPNDTKSTGELWRRAHTTHTDSFTYGNSMAFGWREAMCLLLTHTHANFMPSQSVPLGTQFHVISAIVIYNADIFVFTHFLRISVTGVRQIFFFVHAALKQYVWNFNVNITSWKYCPPQHTPNHQGLWIIQFVFLCYATGENKTKQLNYIYLHCTAVEIEVSKMHH